MRNMKNANEENSGTSNIEMVRMERNKWQNSSTQEMGVTMREKKNSAPRQSKSCVAIRIAIESSSHEDMLRCESNASNKLHRAITISCYESCQQCLDEGMDVNSVDETDGSNALHVLGLKSCKGDSRTLDIARLFIERGAVLDAKDFKGNTSLHIAAKEGLRDCCDVLIDQAERTQKSLVNCLNNKQMTALHLAAQQGQCEVVELLLRRGAKPNVKDYTSWFPLHYALDNGCVTCCRALAPYYEGDATHTKKQDHPLMVAVRKGHYNAIKELSVDKLNVNCKDNEDNTALHIAAKKGFDKFLAFLLDLQAAPDTLNSYGWTPLMAAVAKEKTKCVNLLMERGASLSMKSIDEWNVLHIAAASKSSRCMEILLKNDEVIKLINEKNKEGYTPLALAVRKKNNKCIKLLEEAGASPFIGDDVRASIIYNSPLYRGSILLQERLLREKDVNFVNVSKMTPLHIAALEGNSDACRSLLRKGARIDACDKDGRTPLHWAAHFGHENFLKLLLKNRASRRVQDDKKYTALHCAAFMGKLQCCKVLLETDCGLIKEKDKKGKYALDVAHDQGRFDVFTFLLERFSEKTNHIPEDLTERFHSYVHKMLSAKKKSLLEAVVRSKWWEAAFGLVATKMHGEAPCLLFRDTIKVFPGLAYDIMTKCHSRKDFRLLEDNFCVEEQMTTPDSGHKVDASGTGQGATRTHGQGDSANRPTYDGVNWKRQHPVYTMVSRKYLCHLQHPLIKEWLDYKWQTYAQFIFTLLMILRVFTIGTLVHLLCCIRNNMPPMKEDKDTLPSDQPRVPTYIVVLMGISLFLQVSEEINRRFRLEDTWLTRLVPLLPVFMPTLITFIFLLIGDIMKAYYFGIVALVLAGLHFIHRIDHLPRFNILTSITRDFLYKYAKGLSCAACIVILFAFIFYLLFLGEKEFKSMPYAMLSIALWQMGDFNQEIFFKDIRFPVISHILFIIYLCTFGAFIVTIIKAPSTTKETSLLNKKINMINLIFEIDICFPCIRKLFKNGILSKRDKSRRHAAQKNHCGFWKVREENENAAPEDEIIFMFSNKCKRCGIICKCEEKSSSHSSALVMAKLEGLIQEIKNLQIQINLLQQEADHQVTGTR